MYFNIKTGRFLRISERISESFFVCKICCSHISNEKVGENQIKESLYSAKGHKIAMVERFSAVLHSFYTV